MTTSSAGWVPDLDATLRGRVLLVRLKLDLTQREAAARSGLSFGEWQSIESGRKARGLDDKIRKISDTFGVDRNWLMWGAASGLDPSRSGSVVKPDETETLPRLDSNQEPFGSPLRLHGARAAA